MEGVINNPNQNTLVITLKHFQDPVIVEGTFDFWYVDEACSEKYDPSTTEMSGVTDIYARWTINNYTLKFNFTNGTVSSITLPFNASIEYPEVISEREGFTFIEWSPRPERIPAKNITAKAQWRANKYTITFEANGGSECPSITQDYNTPVTLPVPTKTGYTFAYWCSDIELTTKYTATTMPAEDITLYAKWVINQYTITFDFGNGTENIIELPFNTIIEYPEDNPEKEGFTFIEWSPRPERMPAENITITAQWKANKYTITFDFGNGEKKNLTFNYNESIVPPSDFPSKTFYKFAKWCAKDENGTERCDFATVPAHNLTLTASFDSDSGLVAGTTVAAIVAAFLVIILFIAFILASFTRRMKKEDRFVELETFKEIDEDEELVEERILHQAETTRISSSFSKKLTKSLKKADKNKGVGEILADLEVECDEGERSGDVVESFRTSSVSAAVASAFYNRINIVPAAEYLTLLYTTVRDQEKYKKFEELYFGMKDIDNFVDRMDEETICFGGIVSGFTSKGIANQSLFSKDKNGSTLCGVLFRVQNAMGYRIEKAGDETDEVLLEVGSAFKVEGMREVVKGKYFVVDLSFVSPISENDRIEL